MMNQDYEPHECVSSCHKIKSVYKLQKNKNSRKAIQYSETVKRRAGMFEMAQRQRAENLFPRSLVRIQFSNKQRKL
jgi:hypothetical protein